MTSRATLGIWLVCVALTLLVFGLWPRLDLVVSGLFHDAQRGFWMADLRVIETTRQVLWNGGELLVLLSLFGLIVARAINRPALWLPARVWAFVLLLFVTGPGVAVNLVLKEFWGRARPARVVELGGDRMFTGPFLPTDQCASNCSFVSGEAASAMALGIALFVILRHLRPRLTVRVWRAGVLVALLLPPAGAALRVLAGRHFLSDVICAGLIVAGLALLLDRVILSGKPLSMPRFRRAATREITAADAADPVLTSPATPPIRRHT